MDWMLLISFQASESSIVFPLHIYSWIPLGQRTLWVLISLVEMSSVLLYGTGSILFWKVSWVSETDVLSAVWWQMSPSVLPPCWCACLCLKAGDAHGWGQGANVSAVAVDHCGSLWISADLCGSLKITGSLQITVDLCGSLRITVNLCRSVWISGDHWGPLGISVISLLSGDQPDALWLFHSLCSP